MGILPRTLTDMIDWRVFAWVGHDKASQNLDDSELEYFMTGRVRFGIVGIGNIGTRHIPQAERFGELVAICDVNEAKLEPYNNSNVQQFNSIEAMLGSMAAELDVVSICTPNGMHCQNAIQVLDAGCHVLCEKPMALSSKDCGAMITAAEKNNRRLFVVKQNRYNPPVVAVKKLLDSGDLGKVLSAHLNCFWNRNEGYYSNSWKGSNDLDGGCLFTQFSHFIDLLYWMVGDVVEAFGFSNNAVHGDMIEFEDQGVVSLRMENGVLGAISFSINSFAQNMEGSLVLFCEKGTVKIGGQYLNELEYQSIENSQIEDIKVVDKSNDYGTYKGSMSNHDFVYENLADVLQNGGVIGTSGFEGLKTVEIIEKIYRAIR